MSTGNVPMLVLRALMTKRGWNSLSHLVRVDSFESNEYRRLYQHIERLHGETESDITVAGIRADISIQYVQKPDMVEEMGLVLDRLSATEELAHDLMESIVRRFLERSVSWEIAEYVSNNADKPEFSVSVIADLAQKSVEVGKRASQAVSSILESPLSGAIDNRRTAHGLGISRQLDIGLRGGVATGELCVFLAPPAGGKTSLLCCAGASRAAAGGGVLHVSLEINSRKVIERYDQAWTSRPREELETPEGQSQVQLARDVVRAAGGNVWVVDLSYLNVSANDVGALVRRLRGAGERVDLIIIDYLQLMSPNKIPGKEMRQLYSAIGREARMLARNLDAPVLTAWQVNRDGSDADILSRKHVSESWDIIMTADIIIGLNQTRPEAEVKRMRANIIKQRESTNRGLYELYCDLERMIVRDVTADDTRELINAVVGNTRDAVRDK